MRLTILSGTAAAMLLLSACSQRTQDAATATANSAANDVEANTDYSAARVDNAATNTGDAIENDLDRAGDKIENAAADAARATGNALERAGGKIHNAAEDAKH